MRAFPLYMIFYMLLAGHTYAQDYRDALYNRAVTLHDDQGHKTTFHVREQNKRANLERQYHWYASGRIHTTQGGYSGKVLHGEYRQHFAGNGLATTGQFKRGLKTGNWKIWNSSGALVKQSHWKNSEETGTYRLFDDNGILLEKGTLLSGKRNGKTIIYSPADSAYVDTYYLADREVSRDTYSSQQNFLYRSGYYLQRQWTKLFRREAN